MMFMRNLIFASYVQLMLASLAVHTLVVCSDLDVCCLFQVKF